MVVRCQDLEYPAGFNRTYKRRLQSGCRFVVADPPVPLDSLPALAGRIREMDAPAEFLDLIARDEDPRIRAAVARNARPGIGTVPSLAQDPDATLRPARAREPSTAPP